MSKLAEINARIDRADERPFPLRVGDILFIGASGAELENKRQFQFQVSFNEVGIVERASLVKGLKDMSAFVRSIVVPFESLLP